MHRNALALATAVAGALTLTALASGQDKYEVWAIDQSNSPGRAFGGTLYIWDGHDLENKHGAAVPEKIDLGEAAAALCLASTGGNPVRPHMIAVNPSQTHAIISFVATGHVLFVRADTRLPVACVRTSPGVGGVRQAHMSTPSPDETYVTVANQNGKLFERILTNSQDNPANFPPPRVVFSDSSEGADAPAAEYSRPWRRCRMSMPPASSGQTSMP